MIKKPIEKIEMRCPDGWHACFELLDYEGTFASVRVLKNAFLQEMKKYGFFGCFYFRFLIDGRLHYFTVDR